MSACTERHPAAPSYGLAREGQKRMPGRHSMSACTERHPAAPSYGLAREGQKRMPKGTA
jgi:hypothetical protein